MQLGCNVSRYFAKLTAHVLCVCVCVLCVIREYGTIDDVDIDLHINIGFLDVSQHSVTPHTLHLSFPPLHPTHRTPAGIWRSSTSFLTNRVLIIYLCHGKWL